MGTRLDSSTHLLHEPRLNKGTAFTGEQRDRLGLHDRNERPCYRTGRENIVGLVPVLFAPSVGEAYKRFSHIHRRPTYARQASRQSTTRPINRGGSFG